MVATMTRDTVAGEKLLKYYLSGVENPSPTYIATAVLAVLEEMKPTAPEAFSGMVSYLRGVDSLQRSTVDEALAIIDSKLTEQQAGNFSSQPEALSLEQQFAAELLNRNMTAKSL